MILRSAEVEVERPYIMLAFLRGLFDFLRARRVAAAPILDILGVAEADLRDPDRRIDHSLQNAVFDAAEKATGDVNVGLHAGELTNLLHFGLGGQIAMTCRTVRELLESHQRFSGLLSTGASVEYREECDELVTEATFLDDQELSRHTLEYALASHLTLGRMMAGFPLTPARLELPYAEPADTSEQERVFGCPVKYGCARERFFAPLAVLDFPLYPSESGSRAALEAEALARLAALHGPAPSAEDDLSRLKRFVMDTIRFGPPSVEAAAEALGTSPRTLQRRLEAEQLTYRDIVDATRKKLAERYIADAELSQIDVAFLLGYSDQSAFHRAFRRWFSATPGEFRAHGRH